MKTTVKASMKPTVIVYELKHKDFDAVQIEFHSLEQLEKFLSDNDRFAKAIEASIRHYPDELNFTGALKMVLHGDGVLQYKSFGNLAELRYFLDLGNAEHETKHLQGTNGEQE